MSDSNKAVEGSPDVKKSGEIKTAAAAPVQRRAAKEPEIPALIQNLLIFAGVVLTAYVIGVYNPTPIRILGPRPSRASCDEGSWSLANLKMEKVPRYAWEPSLPFAAQLAGWREPVILTNTFVTQWKALERWSSDEYLRSKPELSRMESTMVVEECQMKPSNPTNALARDGLVNAPENFYSLNATSSTFFSRFNEPNEDSYWYWYGKVENSLKADVEPSEGLWVDALDLEQFGLYMWLSGPDIGPWWHYDQDHNFYVQVAGKKRFVLIPPWETSHMHPYPQIHPRNHKAQVDFDHPNLTATPNYASVQEAYLAELEPGEVLYIPPYWWHHVRSHVRSVSLASWSQSGIYRVMRYGLYKREFAFDELPIGSALRRTAFRFLLSNIARKMYSEDAELQKNFFKQVVQVRWEPIRQEIESATAAANLGDTFQPNTTERRQALCGEQTLDEELKTKLMVDVKAAIEAFENCQTKVASGNKGIGKERRDMQAIRDIEFADFTEFMLANEVGSHQVLPFLDHCLNEFFID